ncbi:unnamed protein product [Cuscuta campestris]|uniref:Uncharacterized protein n=1 Tax=Cuscuta campestris TaxID=132261 RepID=A0A484KSE1_9ASTE|nr:unnamed protein product [Cuscuta campestris]
MIGCSETSTQADANKHSSSGVHFWIDRAASVIVPRAFGFVAFPACTFFRPGRFRLSLWNRISLDVPRLLRLVDRRLIAPLLVIPHRGVA